MLIKKSCVLVLLILSFSLRAVFYRMIFNDRLLRLKFHKKELHKYAKKLVKLLDIEIDSKKDYSNDSGLIISNHLSWLDVILISACYPTVFVSSKEIENTFFLGFMCKIAGTVFVERRNYADLQNELFKIASVLSNDISVCLFPEATSTNGSGVLNFHSSFFETSIISNKPTYGVVINYQMYNNQTIDVGNRDNIFWYGNMRFFPSLISVLSANKINVSLKKVSTEYPELNNRKRICTKIYNAISENYLNII